MTDRSPVPISAAAYRLLRVVTGGAVVRLLVGLLAVLACGATPARGEGHGVIARGQNDRFWLLKPLTPKGQPATTSVRRLINPVAGTWAESTRLAGTFVDAAPLEDRLAVLDAAGAWQLVWDGGSVAGPPPPGDVRLRCIASDKQTLWAVAARDGSPGVLLRWTEGGGWIEVATLPDAATGRAVAVAVFDGAPWALFVDPTGVLHVARHDANGQWVSEASVHVDEQTLAGEDAAFVANAGRPLVALGGRDGVRLFDLQTLRSGSSQGRDLGPGIESVTAVGPSVRAIAVKDDKLVQTAIEDAGRGKSFGPDPIPDPAPPQPPRLEWFNLVLLLGLTVAMLRTLRADPVNQPAIAAGLRPAPMWRRVLAAVIDGSPCLIVGAWVVNGFETSPEALRQIPTTLSLPLFLSLLAYVGHVMVAELLFGTSLGKWLLRLQVVSLDGSRPAPGQVVLRNLLRVVEVALFLPMFMPLMTPTGQRVGDMAAKTLVVTRARQADASAHQSISTMADPNE